MPFIKKGPNKYVTPSGREYSKKQKDMYHATDGFKTNTSKTKKKKW